MGYAKKVVTEATDFVKSHNLVTVPDTPLDVIAMPEFKRGVAIAYCESPGPLDKTGKTFFAVSPTPKDWSKERKESFFREYNNYMIRDLTVHEAMPGHYLQLAHSNQFHAPTLVRAIFQSGPFIEGWAVYCEQVMAETRLRRTGSENAAVEDAIARDRQRHPRSKHSRRKHDREGSDGLDDERDFPTGRRSRGKVETRTPHLGSALDLFRGRH